MCGAYDKLSYIYIMFLFIFQNMFSAAIKKNKGYHIPFISFIFGNEICFMSWPEIVAINISSRSNKIFLWALRTNWHMYPAKCCVDVRSVCLCVTTWQLNKHKHRGQTAAPHICHQIFTWTKWGKYLRWNTFPVTPVYISPLFIRRWDNGGGDGREWDSALMTEENKHIPQPTPTAALWLPASCMIE